MACEDVLIGGVKQEDEGNDGVARARGLVDRVLRRTHGLEAEEEEHASRGRDEEQPAAGAVTGE